ncbi:MAG: DNA mismatch repair protein msh6 [Vezdaea aestivalis]|nr:MAG: DNA mismatch repair protein msh6 [Vezdaea aestivalis]
MADSKKSVSTKKANLSSQSSILGFFQKKEPLTPSKSSQSILAHRPTEHLPVVKSKKSISKYNTGKHLTPAPSSDAPVPDEIEKDAGEDFADKNHGLPSPLTPADSELDRTTVKVANNASAKKSVNYAEPIDSEDDFDPMQSISASRRSVKKRRTIIGDESDPASSAASSFDGALDDEDEEEEMDDFIAPDDSDEEPIKTKKRKRPTKSKSERPKLSPPIQLNESMDIDLSRASSVTKWIFDPENTQSIAFASDKASKENFGIPASGSHKQKPHMSKPEDRYSWLANLRDADRNPPGHPDYDPRTVYIPPQAWGKFSPFEKQYWEIKQKFWDTIVFFKKGKFYELYENDATIGHQLFDLKLTDRVNMRMVGVPESSLNLWANQFVAKGFKIARVDQQESALAKEMRERGGEGSKTKSKEDKVIRRELACVLTAGTLVDGGMLQDDLSTYCVSIKEGERDELPCLGISFVDTATGQFFLTEFVDDTDLTKFETFVAQTRPQELLLEKSCISVKALRILKNNTGPTTIWNYLKPGKEFLTAEVTIRELELGDYFSSKDQEDVTAWPEVLQEARDMELVMSSFGALMNYLRTLKIERELITLGNFTRYDPIKKASSLVLDGQTLINLEIFSNSIDGSTTGTLFALLNRCVTPFGKRLFKQWVCHPLYDITKINNRLDAVEALMGDTNLCNQFASAMTRLPDLERLISRIHAGSCKTLDFVSVLEGFEQVEYTMSLLALLGSTGEGVVGQLIAAMPDLSEPLKYWKSAFDHSKAKDTEILVPESGVEETFDASQSHMDGIHAELQSLLKKYRRDLGSSALEYRDNGKEIYQLEVPIKVKGVPKSWSQMSATQKCKRYYSPELRNLVRQLQEAQETHLQVVKEVAGRFHQRFDEDYQLWLGAVKIIAQLDCLISLAKASTSLGQPACRPKFVDSARPVIDFDELRHPCMLLHVNDFIPNSIHLGGDSPNINLLTGANAAGKSTILRMTCVAVIMAQIGCYVPSVSATLTPVDRIMSRLGANDNIFAAQSTFFVELAETKKMLLEATPHTLVILDELGRGTSSYDGLAVAHATLHHLASHVSCTGFFATHYHSLPQAFVNHPEIAPKRMQIAVDDANRRVTFLYKLEAGTAEGSFGMHCASMCGVPTEVVERAEIVADEWEKGRESKLGAIASRSATGEVELGWMSDVAWLLREGQKGVGKSAIDVLMKAVEYL